MSRMKANRQNALLFMLFGSTKKLIGNSKSAVRPVSRPFTVALNYCRHLFRNHLLATNCCISVAMGAVGDAVQQQWELSRGNAKEWSFTRTWHMSLAGLTTGYTCHYWYCFLDRRFPGKTLRLVVKKVLLDQVVFSPVWIGVYFVTLGLLEGSCKEVVKEELIDKGSQIYIAEWLIWPPAQIINFTLLPTHYRVLFDSVISFGFDVYSPYVKYKTEKTDKSALYTGLSEKVQYFLNTSLNITEEAAAETIS